MNNLATDIRTAVIERLARASTADIFALLCANEDRISRPSSLIQPRFTKIDSRGQFITDSATDWVAVYDAKEDLTWTRKVFDCGAVNHGDAMKAATSCRLLGMSDWKAPTLPQRLSINDYARFNPALDTTYFDSPGSYEWTSTPDAEDPSEFAWIVYLFDGDSARSPLSCQYFVRGVRAGQQSALGV
jgi:hypothetical protein